MKHQWYSLVDRKANLEQGDFLANISIPRAANYTYKDLLKKTPDREIETAWSYGDWVILTNGCDLDPGNSKKIPYVVVCPVFTLSKFVKLNSNYAGDSDGAKSRRSSIVHNKEIGLHALRKTQYVRYPNETMIVNFQDATAIEKPVIDDLINNQRASVRLRLNPPFMEAMALRFGIYFARIGYPNDAPFPTKLDNRDAINLTV